MAAMTAAREKLADPEDFDESKFLEEYWENPRHPRLVKKGRGHYARYYTLESGSKHQSMATPKRRAPAPPSSPTGPDFVAGEPAPEQAARSHIKSAPSENESDRRHTPFSGDAEYRRKHSSN